MSEESDALERDVTVSMQLPAPRLYGELLTDEQLSRLIQEWEESSGPQYISVTIGVGLREQQGNNILCYDDVMSRLTSPQYASILAWLQRYIPSCAINVTA